MLQSVLYLPPFMPLDIICWLQAEERSKIIWLTLSRKVPWRDWDARFALLLWLKVIDQKEWSILLSFARLNNWPFPVAQQKDVPSHLLHFSMGRMKPLLQIVISLWALFITFNSLETWSRKALTTPQNKQTKKLRIFEMSDVNVIELCISLTDTLEKKASIAYVKRIHTPSAEVSHSVPTEIWISVCSQQKRKWLCFASFSPACCCVQYSM